MNTFRSLQDRKTDKPLPKRSWKPAVSATPVVRSVRASRSTTANLQSWSQSDAVYYASPAWDLRTDLDASARYRFTNEV